MYTVFKNIEIEVWTIDIFVVVRREKNRNVTRKSLMACHTIVSSRLEGVDFMCMCFQ